MVDVISQVYQYRGSHYDFGRYQAEEILKTAYMTRIYKSFDFTRSQYLPNIDGALTLLHKYTPSLIEEIKGLSDGLEITMDEAVLLFGGYFAKVESGCSIVMDPSYMVRNYDQHPKHYDGRLVLFQPNDDSYATIGPSMLITGRTDGMNEHGLVIGYNFVTTRHNTDGFVCNMIARMTLETCKTVDEAISFLTSIPHKTAFNYCLLDAKGNHRVVEVADDRFEVREDIVCTNHFLVMPEMNHKTISNSVNRYKLMTDRIPTVSDISDAFTLLNDADLGVFSQKYHLDDGTLHTSYYKQKELKMGISYGTNRSPITIDFGAWCKGNPLYIRRIKGNLQSDSIYNSQE